VPEGEWFEQALGFTRENAPELGKQIVFDGAKAVETGVTQFGTKYNQVIPIVGQMERRSMSHLLGSATMTALSDS
jgi:hypothetical protein